MITFQIWQCMVPGQTIFEIWPPRQPPFLLFSCYTTENANEKFKINFEPATYDNWKPNYNL